MEGWRYRGIGPRYRVLAGRVVRYAHTDLDAFASEDCRPHTAPAITQLGMPRTPATDTILGSGTDDPIRRP